MNRRLKTGLTQGQAVRYTEDLTIGNDAGEGDFRRVVAWKRVEGGGMDRVTGYC